jgi:hypothetical protein
MSAISNVTVLGVRKETDSLGEVDVPARQRRMWKRPWYMALRELAL